MKKIYIDINDLCTLEGTAIGTVNLPTGSYEALFSRDGLKVTIRNTKTRKQIFTNEIITELGKSATTAATYTGKVEFLDRLKTFFSGVSDLETAELSLTEIRDLLTIISDSVDDAHIQSEIKFERDGVLTNVVEDTSIPANNIPLPVKLTDITGDINITAGDLNIHSSHTGGNPDSMQIGDGTEIMLVNVDGSINTKNSGIDLNQYKAQDEAVDSGDPNIEYYGFANTAGAWYILEVNATAKTYRYLNGTTGYVAAWGTREANTYEYIFELTW